MKVVTLLTLLGAAACAANRTTAAPVAAPDARFAGESRLDLTMRGSGYTGTATLKHQADSVIGTFRVTGPGTVHGNIRGRITGNDMTLDLTYDVVENGCKGTLRLAGLIAVALAQGTAEAQDTCVGRMTGTFKLGRS
jgi:hypothetical protein